MARQVRRYLDQDVVPRPAVRLRAGQPFTWVAPGIIRPGDPAPARGRVLLWACEHRPFPCITLRQGNRVIARRRVPWPVAPGRVFHLPWDLFSQVTPEAGDVVIGLS